MMKTNMTTKNQWQWLLKDTGMDHFPDYGEQEELKHKYGRVRQAFEKGEASMDELFVAAEGNFLAWFFRSIDHLQLLFLHPRFLVFTSMLLNEEPIRKNFPAEIVERMVAKYGQREKAKSAGIIDGSYWAPSR